MTRSSHVSASHAAVAVIGGGEFGRSLAKAVARSAGSVLHYSRSGNSL